MTQEAETGTLHTAISARTTPVDAIFRRSPLPDPRDPRGVRHRLAGILAITVSAVLTGARSFAAIGEWAADLSDQQLARLDLATAPEESTLRKRFARLDADGS